MSPVGEEASAPEEQEEPQPPVGHVRVVYLGPVAPHWEVQSDYGDTALIDEFRQRTLARLVLLPPHDPQFRRNRERVVRDAERENIALEWDLGFPVEVPPAGELDADGAPEAASPGA
ncbi:MAG: hypothetical protein M0029_05905 [Actinomycetota bacterium]|jgi:hypothetical protein|nr:hypothetical protein [Actinomycetota bacterium]